MPPEDILRRWQREAPFARSLGAELVSASDGTAVMTLPLSHAVENRKGDIHGGAIATLADTSMAYAIRSAGDGLFSLSTVSLNVSYLAPGTGVLAAKALCTKFGRSTCFAVVDIAGGDGALVATATGVFRVIRAPTRGPRSGIG